eukprot:982107-Prorocentrum_minimum.AAC.1
MTTSTVAVGGKVGRGVERDLRRFSAWALCKYCLRFTFKRVGGDRSKGFKGGSRRVIRKLFDAFDNSTHPLGHESDSAPLVLKSGFGGIQIGDKHLLCYYIINIGVVVVLSKRHLAAEQRERAPPDGLPCG